MALKESELRVLAILVLVILILWAFFGLIWSLLLVFTFLIYAYNFGRHQNTNSRNEIAEDEPDVSLQEKLHDDYSEFQDLPFTGLPKGQFTLRSPMPLLSEVTKRLTFNTSTITPFQGRTTLYNNRELGTPYLSRGSPVAYWRKSNHFSLLNPALQRPSTVKIALPDVTINRTFTLPSSPLKRTTPDHVNPCSRATVLSALKESRKRSYVVDEEEDLELLLRPAKRRGTKPVSSSSKNTDSAHEGTLSSSRPFFGGLKRAAIHENKEITIGENTNKRSKVIGHDMPAETEKGQSRTENMMQKRKSNEIESTHDTGKEKRKKESQSKKAKNSVPTDNWEDQRPAAVAREDKQIEVNSAVTNVTDQETDAGMNDSEHKKSSSKRSSSSEVENVEFRKTKQSSMEAKLGDHLDKDDVIQQPAKKTVGVLREKRKRFTVPRFPSKEDSRRRAVPVYCASNEESEMPQRRMVTQKINQEQIKIDRKLAWERVKQFLDDDDEEEDEEGETSKSGTTAVVSTTTASTSSSLFKVPTSHVATGTGTVTTTTQSLITPALSTGFPQQTTGTPLAAIVPPASTTVQGNAAVTQTQDSLRSLLQSQQALKGSGLVSNLSSAPDLSANVSKALPTATTKPESLVITTSATNPSSTGLQANVPLTLTTTSLSAPGFQFNSPSASSFGNLPFPKSTTTNQLTSLSNPSDTNTPPSRVQLSASIGPSAVGSTLPSTQNSGQKVGFSFPTVSASVTSTSATTSVQGGFNFSAPSETQNTFSLNKTVPQNNPVTGVVANSANSFALTTNTSQNPVVFGGTGNSLTEALQNPFGSLAKTTAAVSSVNSSSIFGQSTTTAQTSFGLTTQNKGTFGSTNMQSLSGSTQQTQNVFGGTSSGAFGATLDKSSTQSPFSQATFGAQSNQNASQNAFGSKSTQNTFGMQQSQPGSQSAFGGKSGLNPGAVKNQNTFGSQANQGQSVFGNQTTSNTFGSQQKQNASQSAFGTQATQNAFGAPLNQPNIQNPFGNQATQNAFGGKPNQSTTQSAFGALNNAASKSSFSFTANTAQTSTNSPFSSFSNKPATQSAFEGTTPSQNSAGSTGGFNFGSPASNTTTSGFNFSATSNNTGGFQFGSGGTSGSFGSFGQTTAQTASPLATPAPPAPSGGFNFASGSNGMAGNPFALSTPPPAFGAPSAPQGASSALTAKPRARLAARRRGKK